MKKVIAILVAALGVSIAAFAQPRAIGIKLGSLNSISYQHSVGQKDFVEANLGSFGFNTISIGAAYDFMIVQPKWTEKGEWGFYAGPGANIASGFNEDYQFSASVFAQVGLEYTFWFPLQLSLDLYPGFGFISRTENPGFYFNVLTFVPSLSVRYRF